MSMGLYYKNNTYQYNPVITPTPTPMIEDSSKPFSGIYSLDGVNIYFCQVNETDLLFAVNEDLFTKATITGESASGIIVAGGEGIEYTFQMKDKSIEVNSNGNQINNGLYQKINNYSLENFYELVFGSKELFVSSYNGKYVKDNIVLYMFQTSETTVEVLIDGWDYTTRATFDILDDNKLESDTSTDANIITIGENEIIFKTESYDSGTNSSIFDGKYIKEGNIGMEDILLNRITYL